MYFFCFWKFWQLERWTEAIQDYEVLRNELPGDDGVAEALSNAQFCLKKFRGEIAPNLKAGVRVAEVSGLEQFQEALSLPGELSCSLSLSSSSVER